MSAQEEDIDTDRGQQIDMADKKELIGIKPKLSLPDENKATPITIQLNSETANMLQTP